jgi:caffeoyl-CoA O-methyltransferase
MQITSPKINEYILKVMPPRDPIQKEMEKYAHRFGFPIIGPMAGTFLRQLAIITDAKAIFEMGSGFGYAAYWFAGGMSRDGKIICTDSSDKNIKMGIDYFRRAGLASMIEYRMGDALDIIAEYDGPFDIILNDVDKEQYPEALELAIPRLRHGGIFISDNVLWSGRIIQKELTSESKAILKFNKMLFKKQGLFSSIIPIRDGLGMAVKL